MPLKKIYKKLSHNSSLLKSKIITQDHFKSYSKLELMPSTLLEIIMIRKSLPEDSSSKWEDNKNKSSKIGLESVMLKDNSEDQLNHLTEINLKDNLELKNLNIMKVKNHPNKPNQKLNNKSNHK